jgi:hypothetical protein
MDNDDTSKIISEAMASEIEESRRAGVTGYMARSMVQASLPHKAIKGSTFNRSNGFYDLTVVSSHGMPYGSIPRLLLSWITTEAVRTRSPVLILGTSLSAFMGELGLLRTGGKRGDITRFRNQTERLFASTIHCRYKDKEFTEGKNLLVAEEYHLWWSPKNPDQLPFWKSNITLGQGFFEEITQKPVPVDMTALKTLKRSPMALDIYFWLTYRMSYLQKNTVIPWEFLQMQFGADYSTKGQGPRDFKKKFLQRLQAVTEIYDTAKVAEADKGLLLKPSPPHVAKKKPPEIPSGRGRALPQSPIDPVKGFFESTPIKLKTETFEKAREAAPGLDIYALEQDWREWMERRGERPENPDKAFIGFCRTKARQHGLSD